MFFFFQGAGTDDETLKRIVISRCEVDMENIKGEYQAAYKETLGKAIAVRLTYLCF